MADQNFARREAQPILWTDLSADQKGAVQQAARILTDLAKPRKASENRAADKNEKHLELFLPPIDDERLNHVILLDGDRGSGKTAVLVTLLDAWNRMLRDRAEPKHKELVAALAGTEPVVPIGLIDLQPLPKSTNLLLYLVGRFQRVVEAIEQVHVGGARPKSTVDRRHPHPWQGVSAEEPASTAKWRDFVHAAALGWNGDIDRRRASLDPEAFVLELEQTERRRLDIVSSFRNLINALVDDYPRLDVKPNVKPLFLLAIDDADTNPEKAEELLDLVRTLWHPRVAFLLTGDSNLFLAMLRARCARSLGDPKDQGIVKYANELAIDIYNKAIPPVHRCRFYHLPLSERLDRLKGRLENLHYEPVAPASSLATLFELFEANEQVQEALPSRERSIADLQNRIDHELSISQPKNQALRNVIAALCRSAFASGIDNPGEHIPHFKPEEDLRDAARRVGNWWFRISNENTVVLPNDVDWTLIVQGQPHWNVTPLQGKEVSNQKIAAGMLAHDVVAIPFNHAGSLPGTMALGLLGALVRVEYDTQENVYSFAWPLPDWPSFAAYFEFGKYWAPYAPVPQKYSRNDVDTLACRFIHAIVLFLRGDKQAPTAQWAWKSLGKDVSVLASAGDPSASQWALARAGLMAAPESGLSFGAANQWLEALRDALGPKWEEARQALKKERRARAQLIRGKAAADKTAADNATTTMLRAIDNKDRNYKWNDIVEHDPVQPVQEKLTLRPLLDALAEIPTPWWPRRPNLAAYFDLNSRRAMFEAETSQERLDALLKAVEPYKGSNNVAAEAILKVWETEVRLRGIPVEGIQCADNRIVSPLLRENPPMLHRELELDVDTLAGSHIYRLEWRTSPVIHPQADEILGALVRGLFDMMVDGCDVPNASSPPPPCRLPYWPGFGTYTTAHQDGYQWPVPAWPTCYDWELLSDAWNGAMSRVHILSGRPGDYENAQTAVNALAYWLITSVIAVFQGHGVSTWLRAKLGGSMFGRAARAAYAARPASLSTARERAYATWCNHLVILAAPESGLSFENATDLFLSFIVPPGGSVDQAKVLERKPAFVAARVERARASGVAENQIHHALRSIDLDDPSQTWAHLVGPHTPP